VGPARYGGGGGRVAFMWGVSFFKEMWAQDTKCILVGTLLG
jgi:hypothetical protein